MALCHTKLNLVNLICFGNCCDTIFLPVVSLPISIKLILRTNLSYNKFKLFSLIAILFVSLLNQEIFSFLYLFIWIILRFMHKIHLLKTNPFLLFFCVCFLFKKEKFFLTLENCFFHFKDQSWEICWKMKWTKNSRSEKKRKKGRKRYKTFPVFTHMSLKSVFTFIYIYIYIYICIHIYTQMSGVTG